MIVKAVRKNTVTKKNAETGQVSLVPIREDRRFIYLDTRRVMAVVVTSFVADEVGLSDDSPEGFAVVILEGDVQVGLEEPVAYVRRALEIGALVEQGFSPAAYMSPEEVFGVKRVPTGTWTDPLPLAFFDLEARAIAATPRHPEALK